MIALLKAVHLLALVLALGSGISRLVLATALRGRPEAAPFAGPVLARLGGFVNAGLILLWLSGVALLASGAAMVTPWAFHAKMAAVLLLTGLALFAWVRVRRGRPLPLAQARAVGIAMVSSGVLAVILAALAFN